MASDLFAWQPAWRAVEPYVQFVRLLAGHYRATKASLGSEDADDLFQEFVAERLPKLVERLALLLASLEGAS